MRLSLRCSSTLPVTTLRFAEAPIATVYKDRHKGTQPIDGIRILGHLLRLRMGR